MLDYPWITTIILRLIPFYTTHRRQMDIQCTPTIQSQSPGRNPGGTDKLVPWHPVSYLGF